MIKENDDNPQHVLISVIVPTEGRVNAVGALVSSLRISFEKYLTICKCTNIEPEQSEIILVDSSAPSLTPQQIPCWEPSWMSIFQGTEHVRQKRNYGVQKSKGQWIAFVDSDCTVASDYFYRVINTILKGQKKAYAGKVIFEGEENFIWKIISSTTLISPEIQTGGTGEVAWCATANLVVQKQLFLNNNGFDESLPFKLGGDDVDFGLRLYRKGTSLHIQPDIIVKHPKEPWSHLKAILPRAWRWGRIAYHLSLRHKERVHIMPPYFFISSIGNLILFSFWALIASDISLLFLWPICGLLSESLAIIYFSSTNKMSFILCYLARMMDRFYHLGTISEYLRHGSISFLWEGMVTDNDMEGFFPDEPIEGWIRIISITFISFVAFSFGIYK